MLTLYESNELTEVEKANAVWSGSFLADREENGLIVQLYSLRGFYVEVFYDPLANKILRFQAFTSKYLLTRIWRISNLTSTNEKDLFKYSHSCYPVFNFLGL